MEMKILNLLNYNHQVKTQTFNHPGGSAMSIEKFVREYKGKNDFVWYKFGYIQLN